MQIHHSLSDLKIIKERSDISGYDLQCGPSGECAFGTRWTDDVSVELGHDGCDTRNGILQLQLTKIQMRPGSDCVVEAGQLLDPYSGALIEFQRGPGSLVSIDHVYSRKAAWDHGASTWPLQKRKDFANDPRNLLATTISINSSKGDRTPADWVPANKAGACDFGRRYINVAGKYGLSVTSADAESLSLLLKTCQ